MRTAELTRNLMILVLSPLTAMSLLAVTNMSNAVTNVAAPNSGPWESTNSGPWE